MTGTANTALIALGGCAHGDDAAALLVADTVRQRLPGLVTVLEAPRADDDLSDIWRRHDTVFLVEAVRTGARPGEVHHLDDPMADVLQAGHRRRQDVLSALDVLSAAQPPDLRRKLVVLCIEGRWFAPEAGVSPEVAAAAHDVSDLITDAVRSAAAS